MRFGLGDGIVPALEEVGKNSGLPGNASGRLKPKAPGKIRQHEKSEKVEELLSD